MSRLSVIATQQDHPDQKLDVGQVFESFMKSLEANTRSDPLGCRVIDTAGAIHLSGIAQALFHVLARASDILLGSSQPVNTEEDGSITTSDGSNITPMQSNSVTGEQKPIPAGGVRVSVFEITFAASVRLGILQRAQQVVGFTAERWNALQATNPGHDHQRYFPGDIISCEDLELLESVRRLLKLESDEYGSPEERLRGLVQITPSLEKGTGAWVSNRLAALLDGVKPLTLGSYRRKGISTADGSLGCDPDGRIWRRPGTKSSHPWYLRRTLKNSRQ